MVKELPQLKIMSYLDSLNSNPPMNTHYLSEKQVFRTCKTLHAHFPHSMSHVTGKSEIGLPREFILLMSPVIVYLGGLTSQSRF